MTQPLAFGCAEDMLGASRLNRIALFLVEINVRFLQFSRGRDKTRLIHAPARLCTKEMLPCVRDW